MKRTFIILGLIIILAAVLRFIKLGGIPSGFVPEEVSSAWDAYSIAKTGRDEWGQFLPAVFSETGGFKLALPSYLMIPALNILGLNEFSVRFPTAAAGVLSVFLTYFLAFEFFKRKDIALGASFLLAISPWHISMSRYAQGVNWGIPFFIAGLLFFLKSQKNPWLIIISGILFALTYYTYFNYLIFTLLFIAVLLFMRRNLIKNRSGFIMISLFLLVQLIFLLPFILQKSAVTRFSQATSVGAIGFINSLNEHRQACVSVYPPIICQIVYNKPVEKITEFSKNLVNHYSATTFFLYGSQLGLSAMPQNWGFFYLFEFPLILIGLAVLIRRKTFPAILIWWVVLYGVPSSLAGEAHIWRMMTLLPLPQIFGAVGLTYIFSFLRNNFVRLGVIAVICFSLLKFSVDYFVYMPYAQGSYSYFGFRDLYQYLVKIEKDYDNIVIAPVGMNFNQLYIYYLFYSRYDPGKYQSAQDIDRVVGEGNWVWVNRIGKWYFVGDVLKVKYPLSDKTLLVIDNSKPETVLYDKTLKPVLLHTIYYANGDPAFRIMKLVKSFNSSNLRLRPVE